MESDFRFEFYNAIKSLERFFDNLKTTISFSKLDLEVRPDLKNEYLKLENEFLVNHKNFLKLNDYINKFNKRSLPFTYPRLKKKRNKCLDNNNEFIN
jgi:cell division protein FtsB